MYLREIPEGARKCGASEFAVTGAPSAAAARVFSRMAAQWFEGQVQDVVRNHLAGNSSLLDAASQMKDLRTGYTIDGEPVPVEQGSWRVPFTAYIFDMADHR